MLRLSLVVTVAVALAVSVAGTAAQAEAAHHEDFEDARPVTVLLNGDPWCEGWFVQDTCWIPVRRIADLLPEPVRVEWEGPAIVHVVSEFHHAEGDEESAEEAWRREEEEEEALADQHELREFEIEIDLDDENRERAAHDLRFALRQLAADREHAERVAQMLMEREQRALQRELKRLDHERTQVELEAQARLQRELAELEHAHHRAELEIHLDLGNEVRRIEREQQELRHYLNWAASGDSEESAPESEREECEEVEAGAVSD